MTLPVWDQALVARELVAMAHEVTGIQFMWLNQDAPQLPYPYGLVSISGPYGYGSPEPRYDDVNEVMYWHTVQRFVATFDIMVDKDDGGQATDQLNARGLMLVLRDSLSLQSTKSRFRNANIAVEGGATQSIVNLDMNVADRWISRAAMDVRFAASTCISEEQGRIEGFEVSSDVKLPDGTQAQNQLVNEPFELP